MFCIAKYIFKLLYNGYIYINILQRLLHVQFATLLHYIGYTMERVYSNFDVTLT